MFMGSSSSYARATNIVIHARNICKMYFHNRKMICDAIIQVGVLLGANKIIGYVNVFSDRASWIDYILITNLMHWLLFIHKILFSSTRFEL